MFYSHEILTSQKYGVATVWLVATLGSKSTLRKVNRRAILDVDVPKACETIMAPEAPMALRLQGSLLYGVSRVYSQQCGYVLSDAQQAQSNMRALNKLMRTSELDPQAGSARPDQLMLPDDPAFLPDLAFPDLEVHSLYFDLSALSIPVSSDSRRLAATEASRRKSDSRVTIGLVIPTSDTHGVGETGDLAFPAYGSQAVQENLDEYPSRIVEDEMEGLLPEVDFEFDGEGNLRITGSDESPGAVTGTARTRLRSDSAASGQVRREHEEGLRARRDLGEQPYHEDDMVTGEDTNLPEAEPFPATAASAPGGTTTPLALEEAVQLPTDGTGPAPHQKQRAHKALQMDTTTELRQNEISQWNRNYISNMACVAKLRKNHKISGQAKKNASFWVFGTGIGKIGKGIGKSKLPGPLDMFSGEALMLVLHMSSPESGPRKRKSPSDEGTSSEAEDRRVRPRDDNQDQIGRGNDVAQVDDDDLMVSIEEGDIELGRQAVAELQDISSAMPWNISASLRGSRQGSSISRGPSFRPAGLSSSVLRRLSPHSLDPMLPSRRLSRMTAESPLAGRGRISGIERLSSLDLPEPEDEEALLGVQSLEDPEAMDFELQGPPENVGTRMVADNQQAREALDRETFNFLDYLRSHIEARRQPRGQGDVDVSVEEAGPDFMTFEELVQPSQNSMVVAAQAFYHTLVLATRNLIVIEQHEAFGEIKMTPLTAA